GCLEALTKVPGCALRRRHVLYFVRLSFASDHALFLPELLSRAACPLFSTLRSRGLLRFGGDSIYPTPQWHVAVRHRLSRRDLATRGASRASQAPRAPLPNSL